MNRFKFLLSIIGCILLLSVPSCSSDDDDNLSGDSESIIVGTWARQVQWAYTNGTKETSYTFNSNGRGVFSEWDWLEQEYYDLTYNWSIASEYYIRLDYDKNDRGYTTQTLAFEVDGNTLYLGSYDYHRK